MIELKHKLKEKFKIELTRFHINRVVNENKYNIKNMVLHFLFNL